MTLNSMLARLEESFERERRFVADASHELRTPIAILKAELEVTLRDGSFDALTRTALTSSIEEADRLTRLADDLLAISRADEEQLSIELTNVELTELLTRSRDGFAEQAKEMDRTLTVKARPGLTAQADPLRLQQAINNLIDNALRYGAGDVVIRAHATPDAVEIGVSDQGSGFPIAFAPHAFERFTRAAQATGRGGSGLGLAIVKAIIQAHGGEAELVVGEGSGAMVRLRLPLAGTPIEQGDPSPTLS